jgi:hypothetical protein
MMKGERRIVMIAVAVAAAITVEGKNVDLLVQEHNAQRRKPSRSRRNLLSPRCQQTPLRTLQPTPWSRSQRRPADGKP